MVQFTFIPKLQEESFCKKVLAGPDAACSFHNVLSSHVVEWLRCVSQWLQVQPPFGIIPPKEKLGTVSHRVRRHGDGEIVTHLHVRL